MLCLCDTNGGTPTGRLAEIVADVRRRFDGVIGIHPHNDSDVAVANALAAVEAGATHVQGCMNGYGERCGNVNLASVIANLELKHGHTTIGRERLARLTSLCTFIAELANLPLRNDQPFVGQERVRAQGRRARGGRAEGLGDLRAHLAGARGQPAAGARERSRRPRQHHLQARSARSGRSGSTRPPARSLLERVKQLEYEGYEFEAAEGSFELLVREALDPGRHFFDVDSYEVTMRSAGAEGVRATATVIGAHGGRVGVDDDRGARPVQCAARVSAEVAGTVVSGGQLRSR